MEIDHLPPSLPEPAAVQDSPLGPWRLDRSCPVVRTWGDSDTNNDVFLQAAMDTPDFWLESTPMPVVVAAAHVACVCGFVTIDGDSDNMVWKTVILDDDGRTWATTSLQAWLSLGDIVRVGGDFVWIVGTPIRAKWSKIGKRPAQIMLEKAG